MLFKIQKLINSVIPLLRKRDLAYLLIIGIASVTISVKAEQTIPALSALVSGFYTVLIILFTTLLYAARWYKIKTGESLYAELLSPDRDGNIIQLIHRARKIYAEDSHNKSKGWNTTLGGHGIVLGKNEENKPVISPSTAEEHILGIGGSGSGKTSALLIPSILRFGGRVFAIDISSDIYNNAKNKRNIALINPHSDKSVAFNVFAHIDMEKDKSKKIILLKKLANLIIPEFEPTKTGDGVYFQQGSHLLFYASLIYYYSKGLDFCDLCFEIVNKSNKELISMLKSNASPPNARMAIKAFGDLRDTNLASMKQTMDSYISIFATSRPVKNILHRNSTSNQKVVSAKDLEEHDIFLCVPHREIVFFAPLMRMISGLVLDYCSDRPLFTEPKILIAMDEFSSLGFIDIVQPLANLRKHNARIMLLTQSLSDIDDIYGITKRRIILDNCAIKILLSVKDRDSQEFFSKMIGNHKVVKKTGSYSNGVARHTYSSVERPIIAPEELGYLRDDCVVLMPDGYLKLKKAYYFEEF